MMIEVITIILIARVDIVDHLRIEAQESFGEVCE